MLNVLHSFQRALAQFNQSMPVGYDASCGFALLLAAVGRMESSKLVLDSVVGALLHTGASVSPQSLLEQPALSVDVVSTVCTALATFGRDADVKAVTESAERAASDCIASSAVQARGLHSALDHAASTADAAHALYGAFACGGRLTQAERMWSSPMPATISRADALLALSADRLQLESPGSAPTSPLLPASPPALNLPPSTLLRPLRSGAATASVAPSMMSTSGSVVRPGVAGRRFTRRPRSSLVAPTFNPDTATGIRERTALSGLEELNEVLPTSAMSVSSRASQSTAHALDPAPAAEGAPAPIFSVSSSMTAAMTAQSGKTSLACR